jgi:peptide/nickel transport system permease protein
MSYIGRRLGLFALTLWAAVTVNFAIPRLMPGNEASAVLATFHGVNPSVLHALEAEFGVNSHQGLISQYISYLGNSFTGNFGLTAARVPVTHEILTKLPWTLGLVGVTTILAFVIGTLVGVVSAWYRGGRMDAFLPPILFIAASVPVFFVALLLIYFFSVTLSWLPLGSNMDLGATSSFSIGYVGDILKHAILPGVSIVIVTAGLWIFSMRNNMISTLTEDYVKMARAKGLSTPRMMFDYAARNAVLPNLTGFAMQLGLVLGGAILVEYTFSYPGLGYLFYTSTTEHDLPLLGYLFYTSTTEHDLPLMQGLFLFYTVAVLVCVLLADFATAILDPRTRDA